MGFQRGDEIRSKLRVVNFVNNVYSLGKALEEACIETVQSCSEILAKEISGRKRKGKAVEEEWRCGDFRVLTGARCWIGEMKE
jgi:hypothetical protein